jgi:hypothetical protein
MNVRRLVFRVLCLFLVASGLVLPVSAECARYECRYTVDTAECWMRMGPMAQRFRLGSSCETRPNCGWYFNEGQWVVACYYDCVIDQCYEI